ncbi:guanyl-nucleotide exchange factor, putative [Entamoeba dispar SAW760]|uniref:Guanyl-nucleotide exchange factor, putative n=1 Tax=Entamoeba dispar (strain ATCC PRA-260 / SAW760) TaxID=370354 RepID=B0EHE1_ENTDS|nr:guanyl-nucleotide exchange factor, putative [Entamoeba dispar SAW760]EDR26046.1 guanyl-nucleotide exchange factor, putative [Entamoeba dispar SAW760]|eukprot:EDR26046.1 guanyl-nucleotide exchange factor, putative [Entamoeba dispar SAW760]
MGDKYSIQMSLAVIQSCIDRKQKQTMETYQQYENKFIEGNNHCDTNQNSLLGCMKIGLTIYYSIKQTDKLASSLLALIQPEILTVNTVQQILELSISYLTAQNIKSNKKILQFTFGLIENTIPFKIEKEFVLENFKLLNDMFCVVSPNDPNARAIRKIQEKYIRSLFIMYGGATSFDEDIEQPSPSLSSHLQFFSSGGLRRERDRAMSLSVTRGTKLSSSDKLKFAPCNDDIFVNPQNNFHGNTPISVLSRPTKKEDKEISEIKNNSNDTTNSHENKSYHSNEPHETFLGEFVSDEDASSSSEDSSDDKEIKSPRTPKEGESTEEYIGQVSEEKFTLTKGGSTQELQVQKELAQMKRRTVRQNSVLEKEKLLEKDLPIHLAILSLLIKNSSFDHIKSPFLSEQIKKSPWKELRGKRPMVLRMEKHILELTYYWLDKCPETCNPTVINKWNIDFVGCLSYNVFSDDKTLFITSLQILIICILKFRVNLKTEIALLLNSVIFFYILSPLPLYSYKQVVISELVKLCQDSQFLNDIFLNYDCDKFGQNIFEDLLNTICFILTPEFKNASIEEIPIKILADMRKECLSLVHIIIDSIKKLMIQVNGLESIGMVELDNGIPTKTNSTSVLKCLIDRKIKVDIVKAKQLFKEKPNDGVSYMIKSNLCFNDPTSIAQFLKKLEGVDKIALGKYLTSNKEFNKEVFKEYMKLIDFNGLSVDEALRSMFNLFVMPGEGQVVDRVMEMFAHRYAECWSDKMKEMNITSNQIYFLATTIIFLSTETHNSNVKTKTMDSYEKFKQMVEQFDFTLPDSYLQPLYQSVIQNAFLIPEQKEKVEDDNKYIITIKNSPHQRPQILLLKSQITEAKIDEDTVESLSISNKDILHALIETMVPIELKSLKIAFDIYNDITNTLTYLKEMLDICIVMDCREMIELIIKTMCEWCVYYDFNSCKSCNIQVTKMVIDISNSLQNKLHGGWKYLFIVLSRFEQMNLIEHQTISTLKSIPKNTRKLFFMEVQHQLYQPKDIKLPTNLSNDIINLKKELKIEIETIPLIFDSLKSLNEEGFCEIIKCLSNSALNELNCVTPPMLLLNQFKLIIEGFIEKNKKINNKETIEIIRNFLLQCMLHPHEIVSMKAIEIFFRFCELDLFKESKEILKPVVIAMGDSPLEKCRSNILEVLKKEFEKKDNYITQSWKEVFEILFISTMDEPLTIMKEGYETLTKIIKLKYEFDEKYYSYFFKTLIKFSLTNEKAVIQDKQSDPIIIVGLNRIIDKYPIDTIDLSLDSHFFDIFFDFLFTHMSITKSQHIIISSLALQSLTHYIEFYSPKLSYNEWYFVFYKIFFRILEPIGYYHLKSENVFNSRGDEWWSSVCLSMLTRACDFISKNPGLLQPFMADIIHIVITFIIRGISQSSSVAVLTIKLIFSYFIDNPSYIPMYRFMIEDTINYMYDSMKYFVELSSIPLTNESKTDQQEMISNEEEQLKCSFCNKELYKFDKLRCPLCDTVYCSIECKEKDKQKHHHSSKLKPTLKDQFIPHLFKPSSLDFPSTTSAFDTFLNAVSPFSQQITLISKEEDQDILICLLNNIKRFIDVLKEIKQPNPNYQNVLSIKNAIEYHLTLFAHEVCKIYPIVIVNLMNEFLSISSDTILLLAFELIEKCDNELLKIVHQQSFSNLLSLIPHENIEIRQHLSSALLKIYNAIK